MYRLSYLWYTVTGALVTMTIGLVVSLISSEKVEKLDPMLLAPFIRKLLKISGKEPHQEASNDQGSVSFNKCVFFKKFVQNLFSIIDIIRILFLIGREFRSTQFGNT